MNVKPTESELEFVARECPPVFLWLGFSPTRTMPEGGKLRNTVTDMGTDTTNPGHEQPYINILY